MAVNKVVYDNTTLIDLTEDTVTPDTLASGATAHNAAGTPIVGTMSAGGGVVVSDYFFVKGYSWDSTNSVVVRNTSGTLTSSAEITEAIAAGQKLILEVDFPSYGPQLFNATYANGGVMIFFGVTNCTGDIKGLQVTINMDTMAIMLSTLSESLENDTSGGTGGLSATPYFVTGYTLNFQNLEIVRNTSGTMTSSLELADAISNGCELILRIEIPGFADYFAQCLTTEQAGDAIFQCTVFINPSWYTILCAINKTDMSVSYEIIQPLANGADLVRKREFVFSVDNNTDLINPVINYSYLSSVYSSGIEPSVKLSAPNDTYVFMRLVVTSPGVFCFEANIFPLDLIHLYLVITSDNTVTLTKTILNN